VTIRRPMWRRGEAPYALDWNVAEPMTAIAYCQALAKGLLGVLVTAAALVMVNAGWSAATLDWNPGSAGRPNFPVC
jgi:hypothetical protein